MAVCRFCLGFYTLTTIRLLPVHAFVWKTYLCASMFFLFLSICGCASVRLIFNVDKVSRWKPTWFSSIWWFPSFTSFPIVVGDVALLFVLDLDHNQLKQHRKICRTSFSLCTFQTIWKPFFTLTLKKGFFTFSKHEAMIVSKMQLKLLKSKVYLFK